MAMEGELPNGLIVGHAYSVTDARTVCVSFYAVCETMQAIKTIYCFSWKGCMTDLRNFWCDKTNRIL